MYLTSASLLYPSATARVRLSAIFAGQALSAQYEKATVSAGCTILAGCLAGCGGGILADLLRLVCSQSL